MLKDYKDWLDSTNGINPSVGSSSFNNIVYSTELIVGKALNASLDQEDLLLYEDHIVRNTDEYGLYIPKNSHDNMTMKICGSIFLKKDYHKKMNLFQAIKNANFHPRDIFFYIHTLGGTLAKILVEPFMLITAIAIILAGLSKGKIRPKFFERLKIIFKKKQLINETITRDGWVRTYILLDDRKMYTIRLHQNDGKILSIFRLLATKNTSIIMNMTARIYHRIMVKQYGEFYMEELFRRYFPEHNHPVIEAWKGLKSPLKG